MNLQGLHRPQRRFREQCARRSDYPLVAKIEAVLGHRLALVEARTSLLHHAVIIVTDRGEVSAQASGGWDAPDGECLGTGVALYTPDGELLIKLDERICDGRTLVIEDEELPSEVPESGSTLEG